MSIGNEHEQALAVFNALRANLDAHHWKYRADEEALTIESGAQGDDLLLAQVRLPGGLPAEALGFRALLCHGRSSLSKTLPIL